LEVEDFADIALMIFPREGRLWNFGGHTNTRTLPYSEYMGWEGRERQCGNGPHPSVLMEINNLEIRSQFTKSRHTLIFEKLTRPEWMYSWAKGFYVESRAGGEVRIFGVYNNKQTDKGVMWSFTATLARSC